MYPDVTLAVLEESEQDAEKVIEKLGFMPEIYSPYFKLLKPKKVKWLHDNGIKVIVWTVNTIEDMEKMVDMEVDGIITDYPNFIKDLSTER
jgi:glycerophosphoryl diester phosphodiesterase